MSRKQSGIQQRVKEIAINEVYIHCKALFEFGFIRHISEYQNLFSLRHKIYSFISSYVVHKRWIIVQNEIFRGHQLREFQRLNDTGWTCRYSVCNFVTERLLLQIDMHCIVMLIHF